MSNTTVATNGTMPSNGTLASNLTQTLLDPVLSNFLGSIPSCAAPIAGALVDFFPCKKSVECLCSNANYMFGLQGILVALPGCNTTEIAVSVSTWQETCLATVPWLTTDNKQPALIAVDAIIGVMATVAVLMRFWSRFISKMKIGWDDYFIIAALILTYGEDIIAGIMMEYGYGKHLMTISLSDLENFLKAFFATQFTFGASVTLCKCSLLFFYLRIFSNNKRIRNGCYVGFVVLFLWWAIGTLCVIFGCAPIAYNWDKFIPNGVCHLETKNIAYGITAANIITDIYVMVLPIPALYGLQLDKRRKIGVMGAFILGGFVCVASLIRFPFVHAIDESDLTWKVVNFGIWVSIECNIGIVCACLPTMVPVLQKIAPPLKSVFSKLSSTFSSTRSRSRFTNVSKESKMESGNSTELTSGKSWSPKEKSPKEKSPKVSVRAEDSWRRSGQSDEEPLGPVRSNARAV